MADTFTGYLHLNTNLKLTQKASSRDFSQCGILLLYGLWTEKCVWTASKWVSYYRIVSFIGAQEGNRFIGEPHSELITTQKVFIILTLNNNITRCIGWICKSLYHLTHSCAFNSEYMQTSQSLSPTLLIP